MGERDSVIFRKLEMNSLMTCVIWMAKNEALEYGWQLAAILTVIALSVRGSELVLGVTGEENHRDKGSKLGLRLCPPHPRLPPSHFSYFFLLFRTDRPAFFKGKQILDYLPASSRFHACIVSPIQ